MLEEGGLSKEGIEIVTLMLMLDPKKRPSCEELLKHDFLKKNVKDF